MKIITCAGYYGTGSSAVTDLLGEFDNIHFMGDYEFRFVQDPDGIADLEYNIVENYHRHNSGHALKRFKKNVDFLAGNKLIKKYEKYFDGQFKKLSYDYINSLTAFKFKGYWHQDVYEKGKLVYYTERILYHFMNRVIVPIFMKGNKNEPYTPLLLKNEYTYVPYSDSIHFYDKTREYLQKLFSIASKGKEFVMVDQLVPPSNSSKYCKLINNIKIISVDRDPRDIYILEKIIWKGGCVPVDNVGHFCQWYSFTRAHLAKEQDDPNKVLRIKFEDMVYHYDNTKQLIIRFLGIDKSHHITPKSHFIPEESMKNTKLWEKYPELARDIKVIEEMLPQYCYNNY